MDVLTIGSIGRSHDESVFFGRKGINVSTILHELDVSSVAMGFIAGFTGSAIEEGLREKDIQSDFVHLKNGFSRINIKIRSNGNRHQRREGPQIDSDDLKMFILTGNFAEW